jgi:RNA polymerase sigma-70 factor (ECF subfamily)
MSPHGSARSAPVGVDGIGLRLLGGRKAGPRASAGDSGVPLVAIPFAPVSGEAAGPEALLVARLRAGDLAALGEAYDAHHVHVRAFARRLLGDESAAEDLVQETFLSLAVAVARFRGDSSLRTFLVSIAVRKGSHHVRAASRRRVAMARFAQEPRAHAPEPDEDAERVQLAAALVRALDTLPVDQRVAVVLCEVEGRTSREAAQIVGVPEATVRTRLFHARRKLADRLAKEGIA